MHRKSRFMMSLVLGWLSCLMLFSSCTHRYYYPKPLQPPLLSASKQIRLNAMVNNNLVNPIAAVSLAGSPLNHLGVQVGFASASFKETLTQSNIEKISHDEHQWNPELGAGYYTHLSEKTLFELYSGWGLYNYSDDAGASFVKKLKHTAYFLQPSIAMIDGNVEMAFTLRYDFLQRHSFSLDSANGTRADPKYGFLAYDKYHFLEPGFTVRFGGKKIMAQVQFSQNFALSKRYETIYGTFKKSGATKFAFGILVNVHRFFEP